MIEFSDAFDKPTEEQANQALIVQHEATERMDAWINEGFDPRVMLAGVGTALVGVVARLYGRKAPQNWFALQSWLCEQNINT